MCAATGSQEYSIVLISIEHGPRNTGVRGIRLPRRCGANSYVSQYLEVMQPARCRPN